MSWEAKAQSLFSLLRAAGPPQSLLGTAKRRLGGIAPLHRHRIHMANARHLHSVEDGRSFSTNAKPGRDLEEKKSSHERHESAIGKIKIFWGVKHFLYVGKKKKKVAD